MKKFTAFLLAALMLLSFSACAPQQGQEPVNTPEAQASDWQYISGKGNMIIGMTLFAPMNYEKDGELIGFETEFTKEVCARLGVEAVFQEINWDLKETELNSKNIDCIWNGMTITDSRKQNMSISIPYMINKQVMIVRKDDASKYVESVDGANIVAEQGSAGEELVGADKFFANGSFTAVDSQAKALMDVASGTSDIAVIDHIAALGSTGEGTDFEGLVIVSGREFEPEEYGVAFRKSSDVITAKVNDAIKEMRADGTLQEIAKKYKLESLLILE